MARFLTAAVAGVALFAGYVALVGPHWDGADPRTAAAPRLTLAQYHQLRDGMSYWGVTEVLGREGVEVSRNRLEGIPGVMPEIVTVAYSWQNPDGSNIQLMFQNGRLVLRAQAGLR